MGVLALANSGDDTDVPVAPHRDRDNSRTTPVFLAPLHETVALDWTLSPHRVGSSHG